MFFGELCNGTDAVNRSDDSLTELSEGYFQQIPHGDIVVCHKNRFATPLFNFCITCR
jgi:hypothetical protein